MPIPALFDQLIRSYGFRVTPQRKIIMQAIWDNGEHASIDEVLSDVLVEDSTISPATVYRTLDLFVERHLVIATNIEGKTVYEIASEKPHHHMICRGCGMDKKFEHKLFQQLAQKLDTEYKFDVESEHLVLIGLCEACRILKN